MHAVVDRNPNSMVFILEFHGKMPAAFQEEITYIPGTVVGKLRRIDSTEVGLIVCVTVLLKRMPLRGIFFDQDFGSMPGMFPVASGGIHVWHMPALVNIFDNSILQFSGGTLGHPWGKRAGAAAKESCRRAWRLETQ